MRRTSWWEDTERFRDLDEIVERSPSGMGRASRWLLIGAMASCACVVGWYGMDRDGPEVALPLSKFDQVLARHTEQHVDDRPGAAASPAQRPSDSPSTAAANEPTRAEPALLERDLNAAGLAEAAPESNLTTSSEGFHIQVASLRSKKRAELLTTRLQQEGHRAAVKAVGLRGRGWWHSVRIGPFNTRIEAEMYRLEFEPPEGRNTVVVPRAKGPYHVQVASVRSKERAEKLAEKLRRRGHQAKRQRGKTRSKGAWHMVRIGPFDSRTEADAYREHFAKREGMAAAVVPFEPVEGPQPDARAD
jgi:cell division septation protein DedD